MAPERPRCLVLAIDNGEEESRNDVPLSGNSWCKSPHQRGRSYHLPDVRKMIVCRKKYVGVSS